MLGSALPHQHRGTKPLLSDAIDMLPYSKKHTFFWAITVDVFSVSTICRAKHVPHKARRVRQSRAENDASRKGAPTHPLYGRCDESLTCALPKPMRTALRVQHSGGDLISANGTSVGGFDNTIVVLYPSVIRKKTAAGTHSNQNIKWKNCTLHGSELQPCSTNLRMNTTIAAIRRQTNDNNAKVTIQ